MNPDTTIVSNIKCRKCGNCLPCMTMTQHLESKFNTECPHTDPFFEKHHFTIYDDHPAEFMDFALYWFMETKQKEGMSLEEAKLAGECLKAKMERELDEPCLYNYIVLPTNWPPTKHRKLDVSGCSRREVIAKILRFYKHKMYRRMLGDHRFVDGFIIKDSWPTLHFGS